MCVCVKPMCRWVHMYRCIYMHLRTEHTGVYVHTHKAYSLLYLKGASDRLVWGRKGAGREHTDRKPCWTLKILFQDSMTATGNAGVFFSILKKSQNLLTWVTDLLIIGSSKWLPFFCIQAGLLLISLVFWDPEKRDCVTSCRLLCSPARENASQSLFSGFYWRSVWQRRKSRGLGVGKIWGQFLHLPHSSYKTLDRLWISLICKIGIKMIILMAIDLIDNVAHSRC